MTSFVVHIDGRPTDARPDETILDAARRLGVEIPTLCHVEGLPPHESCGVCAVEVDDEGGLARRPACATRLSPGMTVRTASSALDEARRVALELLLSEHLGECRAPCELACPTGWDVALYMDQLAAGRRDVAAERARDGLALPETLGWICRAPCESNCRRGQRDEPVGIRALHREVRAAGPPVAGASTGKRVAIVGAGPAGLAAAHRLARCGHDCAVLFRGAAPGGSLRALGQDELPSEVLERELAALVSLGVRFVPGARLGGVLSVTELREDYDAVVVAVGGDVPPEDADAAGVVVAAAGRGRSAIRAVACGFEAADTLNAWLRERPLPPPPGRVRYGRLSGSELDTLFAQAGARAARAGAPRDADAADEEARRCLLCGCRDYEACRLRDLAGRLGARAIVWTGAHRPLLRDDSHPAIVYEANKCILCGACLRVAEDAGGGIGFVGRGFATRVAAAFDGPLAEALGEATALRCAAVCPTSAMRKRRRGPRAPAPRDG